MYLLIIILLISVGLDMPSKMLKFDNQLTNLLYDLSDVTEEVRKSVKGELQSLQTSLGELRGKIDGNIADSFADHSKKLDMLFKSDGVNKATEGHLQRDLRDVEASILKLFPLTDR